MEKRDDARVLEALSQAVVDMDSDGAKAAAVDAIRLGVVAYDAVEHGLNHGMAVVNERYERKEYFIPELLLCADAMYAGLEELRPHLALEGQGTAVGGVRVAIGVVDGDTHDIGKNLVQAMLEASGFEVTDLGRAVGVEEFVSAAEVDGVDVIAMSTLMTTTMERMREVVTLLKERGLRDRVRVIVGGAPVSAGFAREIGADAYGVDAAAAVRIVRSFSQGRACV